MHFFISTFLQSEKNFILQQTQKDGSWHFLALVLQQELNTPDKAVS